MTELLPRLVGPFRLEAKIGQGGMGVVYRATDTTLERTVAVKLIELSDELGPEARATATKRFATEAKAAARIQSRHVAQVLQYGTAESGELYIAMELLDGVSLSRLLSTEGRLSAARAVAFGRQICRGLHVAHGHGVIHRDLKAANIMVVSADGDDEVIKILDFGVAKLTADSSGATTQQGMVVGTLNTMAPEQLEGKQIDGRADVYALGVLLYRMLTGTPVFDSSDVATIIRHQLQTAPQPLQERAPDAHIPAELADVVMRCLAKDPAGRPASMKELEQELALSLGIEVSDSWSLPPKTKSTNLDDATLTPPTKSVIEFAIDQPRQRPMMAAIGIGAAAVLVLLIVGIVVVMGTDEPPAVALDVAREPVVARAPHVVAPVVVEPEAAPIAVEPVAVEAVVEPVAKPKTTAPVRVVKKKPKEAVAPTPEPDSAPKLKRVRTKETP